MASPDSALFVFDTQAAAEEANRTLGQSGFERKPPMNETMDTTTHCARITGPISYLAGSGRKQSIPLGPCLVESLGGRSIDIIWGARGQRCVALPIEEIEAAQDHGHLVLLD